MRPSGQKGFTIIEIAVVLVIIGLIVGFGASLVVPLTMRAKRTESRETLKAAKESIVGFAAANGRLPVWDDNISDATIDEFCEVITNRKDAFTQPLYYFPVDANNQLKTAGAICGRKTTNLTVCRDPACTSRVSNVAFVVATGAENVNPQTGIVPCPAGLPAGETCIGAYDTGEPGIDNCTTNLSPPPPSIDCPNYDAAVIRLNRPEEYDDIVEWVTLNELKVRTGCQGPPLQILNNELPSTSLGSVDTPPNVFATVFATGGIPNVVGIQNQYRWCVEIRDRNVAQGLPNGIAFRPNFIRYPDDINPALRTFCSDQAEAAWPAWANNLLIDKTATLPPPVGIAGSFKVTVFSRDNNDAVNDTACNATSNRDSCAQKSFVITINP